MKNLKWLIFNIVLVMCVCIFNNENVYADSDVQKAKNLTEFRQIVYKDMLVRKEKIVIDYSGKDCKSIFQSFKDEEFLDYIGTLDDITISDIKNNILISIQKYLSNLSIGEGLIIDQLTKVIMNTDEHIIDYSCAKFTINGEEVQLVNQETSWCSKFETENIKII